jgi:hypothetical protein
MFSNSVTKLKYARARRNFASPTIRARSVRRHQVGARDQLVVVHPEVSVHLEVVVAQLEPVEVGEVAPRTRLSRAEVGADVVGERLPAAEHAEQLERVVDRGQPAQRVVTGLPERLAALLVRVGHVEVRAAAEAAGRHHDGGERREKPAVSHISIE